MKRVRAQLGSVVMIESPLGLGGGFYATESGIIVTNAHVVGPLQEVTIRRYDRTSLEARVVRAATTCDLALIWDPSADAPPPIALREGDAIQDGDPCFAIGHPVGLSYTVTRGVVSSAARRIGEVVCVQTDAVIHPGSSGGPLLDEEGRVIGVTTFSLRDRDGLNFALGVRYVRELLGEVIVAPKGRAVGGPGQARCPECGARNAAVRRSCRRCARPLGSKEATKAYRDGEAPAPLEVGAGEAPAAEIPGMDRILQSVRGLTPAATRVAASGQTADVTWRGVEIAVAVHPGDGDPLVSLTASVADLDGQGAAAEGVAMRRALEINASVSGEAKIGLRGGRLLASAERTLADASDGALRALFRRLLDVRSRFLGEEEETP